MKRQFLMLSVCAASLAACSGGEDAMAPPPPPPPPTPAPAPAPPPATGSSVAASGAITGFGSIIVNGERYDIANDTVVSVDDEGEVTGDDSQLRLGMRVEIVGTETSGARTATRIDYDDDIEGPVAAVAPNPASPAFGRLTIAGQTVVVDANTVFDDDFDNRDSVAGVDIRDLDPALQPGGAPLVVEVSGYPTDSGVLATRLEMEDDAADDRGDPSVDDDEFEVTGFVDSVASDGSSFAINDATFQVTTATDFDDGLAANSSLEGVFVEVEFDISGGGDFIAVDVDREDDFDDFDGDDDDNDFDGDFEIEGLLQAVDLGASPNVIVLNGLTIEVSDASALAGRIGELVEIEGDVNSQGIFVIDEIEQEAASSVLIEDIVAAVDGGVITTRLGVTVTPTADSRVEDDDDDDDRLTPEEFLSRVAVGDEIEARGVPSAGGVAWTRIEIDDDDDDEEECVLRGPVDAGDIGDPRFSILGVTIDTTGLDDDDFEDEDDDIGRRAFFSQLTAGDIVRAESDDDGLGCADGRLSTGTDGEVAFDADDDVEGSDDDRDDDDREDDDDDFPEGGVVEASGVVSALDSIGQTFRIAGRLVTVTDQTLIDDDIVNDARGRNDFDEDVAFGSLPETLGDLLQNGDEIEVTLDEDGNAVLIDDDD